MIRRIVQDSRGQSFKELAHGDEVQLVRAVEHHGLNGQGLAQILGGLRLSRPSRARGSPPKLQVECSGEGQVAPETIWVCLNRLNQP